MKLLTITVPCYNSENYMKKCVDSLLEGGENVEILIVDDGSSDKTAQIADEYAEKISDDCEGNSPRKWRTWGGSQYRT